MSHQNSSDHIVELSRFAMDIRIVTVKISLPSGLSQHVSVPWGSNIGDLKEAARRSLWSNSWTQVHQVDFWVNNSTVWYFLELIYQDYQETQPRSFGKGFLNLVASNGEVLKWPTQSLQEAEVKDGDLLTGMLLGQTHVAASAYSFALWCPGSDKVVTWGDAECGGNQVRQLGFVKQIQVTDSAFAGILNDGRAVAWGMAIRGGDHSPVEGQLHDVQALHATDTAFAALLSDGSVVAWGGPNDHGEGSATDNGADASAVQDQLVQVKELQATKHAFAAIKSDQTVVTWGFEPFGGDSSQVQDQLQGVTAIQSTDAAFAALLADGRIVTWGDPDSGGDSQAVHDELVDVQQILNTQDAFAAVAWLMKYSMLKDRRRNHEKKMKFQHY